MAVTLSFIIGIIGNVISLLVFTSPMGTFWRILKKKSTENYKSLPYISTLLSTSLWTFYGFLKPGGLLIITVNGAGAVLQLIYVTLFIIFAPKAKKVRSSIAFFALNVGFAGAVIGITLLAMHGNSRITLVGVVCAVLTIGMYASPLFAMSLVIKTRSVKYMPFFLSLFLFLNAGVWSAYSVLVKDFFIGLPNGLGFVLGSVQLILYAIYKDKTTSTKSIEKITSAAVEEGFAHLEMKMSKFAEEGVAADSDNNKQLANGKSLPILNTRLARQISSLPVLLKALSLGPYDINYSFSRDKDDGKIDGNGDA